MREPDFRFYGTADSLRSRNDMGVTVSCRDEDGDCLLGPHWLSIARRTHRIHLSKAFLPSGASLSNLRLNAYTKLLRTRVTNISDWHSTEGLNATTTPTVWEVLDSRFHTFSFPLEIVEFLVASNMISHEEHVPIYATWTSGQPIAAILRPRHEVDAVAPTGKKKNPNRRVLVPHPAPEHPLFVLHSAGCEPEIIVSKALRDGLLARFKHAISFYGKGYAGPA